MPARMKIRSKWTLLFLGAVLCLSSCGEPDGGSHFIKGCRAEYEFVLPQIDSLSLYDFSLYTSLKNKNVGNEGACFPIIVRWVSPQSEVFSERVWMSLSEQKQLYRKGMLFPRSGEWRMAVYPQEDISGINGLGLSWEKYGTR